MKLQEFNAAFHTLIDDAIKSNLPVPAIVLQLEMTKIELGYMHIDAMRALRAQQISQQICQEQKIITPNTN